MFDVEHVAIVSLGQHSWDSRTGRCLTVCERSEVFRHWGSSSAFLRPRRMSLGKPLVGRALLPPETGDTGEGAVRPGGNCQDDTVACRLSQHRQDTGTTTKPRMKSKEEFYFHDLTNCRTPEAAPRQRHISRDAGTVDLGPP